MGFVCVCGFHGLDVNLQFLGFSAYKSFVIFSMIFSD